MVPAVESSSGFVDIASDVLASTLTRELGLRPGRRDEGGSAEWLSFDGPVDVLVGYDFLDERISVLVRHGLPVRFEALNVLLTALGVPDVPVDRVRYTDTAGIRARLTEYRAALSDPRVREVFAAGKNVLEEVFERGRPGPNTPRYLWPNAGFPREPKGRKSGDA